MNGLIKRSVFALNDGAYSLVENLFEGTSEFEACFVEIKLDLFQRIGNGNLFLFNDFF